MLWYFGQEKQKRKKQQQQKSKQPLKVNFVNFNLQLRPNSFQTILFTGLVET